jgi:hypothetical protein
LLSLRNFDPEANVHFVPKRFAMMMAVWVLVNAAQGQDQKSTTPQSAIVQDKVIAGGPKDFMEVRHVILRGRNEDIGHALASIARERLEVKLIPASDRMRIRSQQRYIEKNYPILFERMRGVAKAFDLALDDDRWNFGGLGYPPMPNPGCSVMYFPPGMTSSGKGIVSRDYDFTTGTILGTWPAPGQLPCTARPYVIEMYPNNGYSSIAVCSYDLLSGVLDGINSEGLTVALLADDELAAKFKMDPSGPEGVGLGALQVLRLLLDTCANVQEAKEALLLTKQYYEYIPVHYLVADRNGHSFVWEYSQAHNREYIIDNPGKPLVTTNFSLHRYLEGQRPPSADKAKSVCPRYCILVDRIAKEPGKLSTDWIKETHKQVDAAKPSPKGSPRPPGRTLWHSLYVPEERRVQVSFYLRDEPDTERPGQIRIIRSEYLQFALEKSNAKKDGVEGKINR